MSAIPKPTPRVRQRKPIKRTSMPPRQSRSRAAAARRKADREWAAAVKERAAGICEWCERELGSDAHHVLSRRYLRSRHEVLNGVYLSRACHRKAHRQPVTFGKWLALEHPDRHLFAFNAFVQSLAKQEAS
jgi:hypothetical protein